MDQGHIVVAWVIMRLDLLPTETAMVAHVPTFGLFFNGFVAREASDMFAGETADSDHHLEGADVALELVPQPKTLFCFHEQVRIETRRH